MQNRWHYRSAHCPECNDVTIQFARVNQHGHLNEQWKTLYPLGANRGPIPIEVPAEIATDYIQACNVLPISAMASAALSRRCLQNMLHAHEYRAKDLAKEIDLLLNETDPKKRCHMDYGKQSTVSAILETLAPTQSTTKTTLQVIEVEPHEAEWCLEIIENMFEHFYVGPAMAKAKKAALDAKLAAAGKPPSKS